MSFVFQILFCLFVLFEPSQATAPPEHVAKYLRRCEEAKAAAIKARQDEIKALTSQPTPAPETVRKLERTQAQLKQLQEAALPMARLPLPPAKGDIGIFELPPENDVAGRRSLDVLEIVDDANAIVRAWYASADEQTFVDLWIEGIEARRLVVGSPARLPQVFQVTGNKSFGTTCGQRSLPLLKPIDLERYLVKP